MEDLKDQSLFEFEVKKHKKQKVLIADIILIPGFENENYMVDTIDGLGLLDDNIYLVKKGNKLDVIDGYRRLMALKANDETEVSAFVFETIDAYKGAMITLATNNARSNNPIAELNAILILEKRGIKPATMRKLANISKSKISKLKSVLKLDKVLQTALRKNKLTFTMAYEISKLDKKIQSKLVKIYQDNGTITGDDLKEVKKKKKEKMAAELPDSLFEDYKPDMVQKLVADYEKLTNAEKGKFKDAIK